MLVFCLFKWPPTLSLSLSLFVVCDFLCICFKKRLKVLLGGFRFLRNLGLIMDPFWSSKSPHLSTPRFAYILSICVIIYPYSLSLFHLSTVISSSCFAVQQVLGLQISPFVLHVNEHIHTYTHTCIYAWLPVCHSRRPPESRWPFVDGVWGAKHIPTWYMYRFRLILCIKGIILAEPKASFEPLLNTR